MSQNAQSSVVSLPNSDSDNSIPIQLRSMPVYPTKKKEDEILALVEPFWPANLPEQWNGDWGMLRTIPLTAGATVGMVCDTYRQIPTANMAMLPLLKKSVPDDFCGHKFFIIANRFWQHGDREEFIVVLDIDKAGAVIEGRFRTDTLVPKDAHILLFK